MVGAHGTPELALSAIGHWPEALEGLLARIAHRRQRASLYQPALFSAWKQGGEVLHLAKASVTAACSCE